MRRIIYLIIFMAALLLATTPGTSMAKRHVRHRARATRVITRTRTVYTAPRSHGVGANGNVGVGLGPIHVGVGAGAGVNTHVRPAPNMDIPMLNGPSDSLAHPSKPIGEAISPSAATMSTHITSALTTSAPVVFYTTSSSTITPPRPVFVSEDTNANVYYYTYVPPKTVTVGGFSTAVTGNPMYYSLFKHRNGQPMPMHNHKGEDVTAGFGVSPRASDIPESILAPAYSAAPISAEEPIVVVTQTR